MKVVNGVLLGVILLGAGCLETGVTNNQEPVSSQPNIQWEEFETDAYSISYPDGFTVTPATGSILWTTIKADTSSGYNGNIQIWSSDDLPERPIGGGNSNKNSLPIFEGTAGVGLDNAQQVRVTNLDGDEDTKKILMEILATLEIK